MHKCSFQSTTMTQEQLQNVYNWTQNTEVPISKLKRFISRRIHKLKKILKLRSNMVAHKDLSMEEIQNAQNEQMCRENRLNEELERQYQKLNSHDYSDYYNGNFNQSDARYFFDEPESLKLACTNSPTSKYSSICYVFMPGQADPVPVKLRTTRIPGGVMWISYRPDLDIHSTNCCSYTAFQHPQAQQSQVAVV